MLELVARWGRGEKFSQEEGEVLIREANAHNGMNRGEVNHETLMLGGSKRGGAGGSGSGGVVAVIPIVGMITPSGQCIEKLTSQWRQAISHPSVKAIVFDVDSPGGSVEGVPELASEIFAARKQKPIIAACNAHMHSAAYWLASAAGEVVITPSGQCGSIGVYTMHQDESKLLERVGIKITIIKAGKYKAEGGPSEPLSSEAFGAFQSKVDAFYGMFAKAVAQHRGTSQAAVRDGYGQGRSLLAGEAVKQNLADRVGTLDDVLMRFGINRRPRMAAGRPPDMDPEDYALAAERRRQLLLGGPTGRAKAPHESEDWATSSDYTRAAAERQRQLALLGANSRAQARPSRAPGLPESREAARRRRQLALLD